MNDKIFLAFLIFYNLTKGNDGVCNTDISREKEVLHSCGCQGLCL